MDSHLRYAEGGVRYFTKGKIKATVGGPTVACFFVADFGFAVLDSLFFANRFCYFGSLRFQTLVILPSTIFQRVGSRPRRS